jgi:hypothetical protein
MYAKNGTAARPARPTVLPTRMTAKAVADQKKNIRKLWGYQFGAYDDQGEAVAFDQQQDFFSGVESSLRKKRAFERALWGKRMRGTRYAFLDGDDADNVAFDLQQDQFGIAPFAVAAGLKTAGVKLSFKKSPRVFGGPMVSTVNDFQRAVERGDLGAINGMDSARRTAKDRAAWARIWNEMLPSWRYNSTQYALIKQLDPSFNGPVPMIAPVGAPGTVTPGYMLPAPPPIPVGVMAPGGGGGGMAPAPSPYPYPSATAPAPAPDGSFIPEASDATGAPPVPKKPSAMGFLGDLGPTGMLVLAGTGLYLVSLVAGGRKRNPPRRRGRRRR